MPGPLRVRLPAWGPEMVVVQVPVADAVVVARPIPDATARANRQVEAALDDREHRFHLLFGCRTAEVSAARTEPTTGVRPEV